ncbi:MAG: hypothetical protein ACTSU4_13770 [Promethearchaeota archaeon]
MGEELDLNDLFISWESCNSKIAESLNTLNFSSMRNVRDKQRGIEDTIYSAVINNAPSDIKKFLPKDCGDMEIGYDITNKKFYFLMEDPEQDPNEEKLRILAITIDVKKNVNIIRDFQLKED